jgi:maltose alpha-D-glucosyltransferase/alpha-amylase
MGDLPESVRPTAQRILGAEEELLGRMRRVLERKLGSLRTRCHGDYHLGQVLYTGKDFVIIDFEGEPSRSLSERRLKRSPLRDVAGMIRSFHYASHSATFDRLPPAEPHQVPGLIRPEDADRLHEWAHFWYSWVASTFLRGYRIVAAQGSFLPASDDDFRILLDALLLEKAIYEVGYELNHRPDWLRIPLAGIAQLLEGDETARPAT